MDRDVIFYPEFDAARLHDASAQTCHFQHFRIGNFFHLMCILHDTRICRVYTIHIGEDLTHICMHRTCECHRCRIAATATQCRHIAIFHETLEACHDDDLAFFQLLEYPLRLHIIDGRFAIRPSGNDACLRACERYSRNAELSESHRHKRNGDLLTGSQQHIHFTSMIDVRYLRSQCQEIIGGIAHSRYDDHDLVPRLPIAKHTVCNIQHFFRCRNRTSAEFFYIK